MTRTLRSTEKRRRKRVGTPVAQNTDAPEAEYRVGPGRPPKEFQFKPGESGNPRGARRKPSIAPDLRAALERALGEKVTLRQGDKEQVVTKAAAGIEQLVNQFAKGERHARRDLIDLANKLGVDLVAGRGKAIEEALEAVVTAEDQALLDDYVRRRGGTPDHRGDDHNISVPRNKSSKDSTGETMP
jgi:hypothetical protein